MKQVNLHMSSVGQGRTFSLIDDVLNNLDKKILFISFDMPEHKVFKRIRASAKVKGVKLDDCNVTVLTIPYGSQWEYVESKVKDHDYDLLIIDSLHGLCSANETPEWKRMKDNFINIFDLEREVSVGIQLNGDFFRVESPDYSKLYKNMEMYMTRDQIAKVNPFYVRKIDNFVTQENLRTSERSDIIDLKSFSDIHKNLN